MEAEPLERGAAGPDAPTSVTTANLRASVCFGERGGLRVRLRVKWEMLVYNF